MAYDDFEDKSTKIDDDYFKVVIPDLDPETIVPIQLRWQYADKTYGAWSASKSLEVPAIKRPEATNIVAQWVTTDLGVSLEITWDAPDLSNGFVAYLTSGSTTVPFSHTRDRTKTQQKLSISSQQIIDNFNGVFVTNLTGLLKTIYIDNSTTGATFIIPPYSDGITNSAISDSDWLVTSTDTGYTVSWNKVTAAAYWETEVWQSDTINGTYIGKGGAKNAPVAVQVSNTVYVKIRHRSISNTYSQFSNPKEAKRYDPIFEDVLPPNDVTINNVSWSGDDILINYTMPATDPPTRFKVVLVNGSNSGFFYDYPPSGTGTHNLRIKDSDIFFQFGTRYNSYTGTLISIDGVENPTSGVAFVVPVKTNPLENVTPTFTLTAISNGYVADFSNVVGGVGYIEVYAKSTTFAPLDPVTGTIPSQFLVYSGANPGFVIDTDYNKKYVRARYFTLSGQASRWSAEQEVTPADPGSLSLIDNPVKIATDGSIFTGDLDVNGQPIQSGARVFFNRTGLFVYDATNVSPTTQIVGDASTSAPTFITTRAKIADWIIYPDRFENGLTATAGTYTGLAPSGSYAIWAGGNSSKNSDGLANFSVTHGGQVVAKKISIVGDGDPNSTLISSGGTFSVTQAGFLNAQNADIKGTIEATNGVFSGKVLIGSAGKPNGFLAVEAGTGFFEIGYGLTKAGNPYYGIQAGSVSGGTRTNNFEVRALDGYLFSRLGEIGGWSIDATKLSAGTGATTVGLASSGTFAIWAGSSVLDNNTPFSVTSAGALRANSAFIRGEIRATSGRIGSDTLGWQISGDTLRSYGTPDGTNPVILNSSTGEISGAKVTGSKVFGSTFFLNSSGAETNTDFIKSDGTLRLANGAVTYNGSEFRINGQSLPYSQFKIGLAVTSDENGTFGDATVVQNSAGFLATGRAFYYGGNNYPDGATSRSTSQDPTGRPFVTGDIWLSRKA